MERAEVRKAFGTLDIIVANARPELAKFYQKPLEISLEAWDHAMDSQAKANPMNSSRRPR